MKLKLATAAVVLSSAVSAQDYQWFSDFSMMQSDVGNVSTDAFSLSGQYFFDEKKALGPYGEFEYINKTSQVFANYINVESGDFYATTIGGDAFVNNVLLGASYTDAKGNESSNSLSLGYLLNENLLVRVDRLDGDNMDATYFVSAAYNHQLNNTDYVGFTVKVDDEIDTLSLSTRYFTHLGDDRYFAFDAEYQDFDIDSTWELGAHYYFSKATGVSASVGSDDSIAIGLEHFFNPNVAIHIDYSESELANTDSETLYLGVSAQF